MTVMVAEQEELDTYLKTISNQMQYWVEKGQLQRVSLVLISGATQEVLEQWTFKVESDREVVDGKTYEPNKLFLYIADWYGCNRVSSHHDCVGSYAFVRSAIISGQPHAQVQQHSCFLLVLMSRRSQFLFNFFNRLYTTLVDRPSSVQAMS